jgi:hypothetical protein
MSRLLLSQLVENARNREPDGGKEAMPHLVIVDSDLHFRTKRYRFDVLTEAHS